MTGGFFLAPDLGPSLGLLHFAGPLAAAGGIEMDRLTGGDFDAFGQFHGDVCVPTLRAVAADTHRHSINRSIYGRARTIRLDQRLELTVDDQLVYDLVCRQWSALRTAFVRVAGIDREHVEARLFQRAALTVAQLRNGALDACKRLPWRPRVSRSLSAAAERGLSSY